MNELKIPEKGDILVNSKGEERVVYINKDGFFYISTKDQHQFFAICYSLEELGKLGYAVRE